MPRIQYGVMATFLYLSDVFALVTFFKKDQDEEDEHKNKANDERKA